MVVRLLAAVVCVAGAAVFVQPALAAPSCAGRAATIVGTAGNNTLHGTPGRDVIVGLGGLDEIHGEGGDDFICGGSFADTLYGGSGDDFVNGGSGSDFLTGGSGDDLVRGGRGTDTLYAGGRGDDVYEGGSAFTGNGHDRLSFERSPRPVHLDLLAASFGDVRGDRDVARGIETYAGSPDDDRLAGDRGPNQFFGLGGDDVIEGRGGSDFLDAGSGDDDVRGGPGRDSFNDSSESDSLGSGNDIFRGGDEKDTFLVGDGINTVHGGARRDYWRADLYPVSIDLAIGVASVAGDPNVIAGVERVRAPCTQLLGDNGPNTLLCPTEQVGAPPGTVKGRGGNDRLDAHDGAVDGGSGFDRCRGATIVNCEAAFRLAALPR